MRTNRIYILWIKGQIGEGVKTKQSKSGRPLWKPQSIFPSSARSVGTRARRRKRNSGASLKHNERTDEISDPDETATDRRNHGMYVCDDDEDMVWFIPIQTYRET